MAKYPKPKPANVALLAAVKRGLIKRQPCEVCGAFPTHGHHPDYSRFLDVQWLCPTHHREVHRASRLKQISDKGRERFKQFWQKAEPGFLSYVVSAKTAHRRYILKCLLLRRMAIIDLWLESSLSCQEVISQMRVTSEELKYILPLIEKLKSGAMSLEDIRKRTNHKAGAGG